MATLTIRNLDPATKERLRIRAAEHGHSMEAEARRILTDATAAERPPGVDLAEAIGRRFAPFGGVDLKLPERQPDRIRRGSTDVRARHQCAVRPDVTEPGTEGDPLGCPSATSPAVHTAISQAEILAGIAVLPEGRRRQALAGAARAMFEEDFAGRVLPFKAAAAGAYAEIFAARQNAGRPIAPLDLMIAAVARARDASV